MEGKKKAREVYWKNANEEWQWFPFRRSCSLLNAIFVLKDWNQNHELYFNHVTSIYSSSVLICCLYWYWTNINENSYLRLLIGSGTNSLWTKFFPWRLKSCSIFNCKQFSFLLNIYTRVLIEKGKSNFCCVPHALGSLQVSGLMCH